MISYAGKVIRIDLRVVIYDWKTSLKKPTRQWMDHRLQTRVYPYLLAQAGNAIIGEQLVNPEQIEMIYWFVEQPKEAHIFTYSGRTVPG